MQEKTETQVLPPPAALISKNPLKWFKFFGPGAIVAFGGGEALALLSNLIGDHSV